MESALLGCGFSNIKRCAYGHSNDIHFQGIEMHGKNIGNDEIASFETMIFEGTCVK
ncbi:hypothetical protein ACFLTX_02855 [Chloroflexota bacterium]